MLFEKWNFVPWRVQPVDRVLQLLSPSSVARTGLMIEQKVEANAFRS